MRRALLWLKDRLWLLFVVVGGITAWLLLRPAKKNQAADILKTIARERRVIDERTAVRRRQIEVGAAQATFEVKKKHEQRLAALNSAQQEKAHELEADPTALSDFIMRNAK